MQSNTKIFTLILKIIATLSLIGSSIAHAQATAYACSYHDGQWAAFGYPNFTPYIFFTAAETTNYMNSTYCSNSGGQHGHCGCSYSPTNPRTLSNGVIMYDVAHTHTNIGPNNGTLSCSPPGATQSYTIADGASCTPIQPGNWRIRLFGKTDTYPSKTPQNVVAAASRVENYYVLVEKDGAPVANKFVELDMQVTQDSGGHNENAHLQPRPKGAFSRMSGYTDIKGKFTFTWTVPEVSGYYQLRYSCDTCNNFTAVKAITVGVHGLNYFGDNEVAGLNGETIYARTAVNEGQRHAQDLDGSFSAYWIENVSRTNLWQLIQFMNREGWGIVALNDISLEMGGTFDLSGNWAGSHREHRDGSEVDISFTRANNVVHPTTRRRIFSLICDRSTNGPGIAATILYHDVDAPLHFHARLRAQKGCESTSDPVRPPRNPANHTL